MPHGIKLLTSMERSQIDHLAISDTSPTTSSPEQSGVLPAGLQNIRVVRISGNNDHILDYLPFDGGPRVLPSLTTLHFTCGTERPLFREIGSYMPITWKRLTRLENLTTHLFLLPRMSLYRLPSSLRTLEIIPVHDALAGDDGTSSPLDSKAIILRSLNYAVALKSLSAPAVWRSDEIIVECGRRGIALSWT